LTKKGETTGKSVYSSGASREKVGEGKAKRKISKVRSEKGCTG